MNIKNLVKNYNKNYIGGQEDIVIKKAKETQNLLLSEEDFSVIDILSEGPIAGLVDKNGKLVDGERILCGVYFNDVPVRETTDEQAISLNTIYLKSPYDELTREQLIPVLNTYKDGFKGVFDYNLENSLDIEAELALLNQVINANLIDILDGDDVSSFNSYLSDSTPINYDLSYTKYLLIDYSNISDEWGQLNLSLTNKDFTIMYSGENGFGILKDRIRKADETIYGNFSPISVGIPDPIANLNTTFNRIENSVQTQESLAAGYILIPIAKDDVISTDGNGNIYFSEVDSECIDPVSKELEGAKIFLASLDEDESNVFNYDKISFELRNGAENQGPVSNRTSRSVSVNFKLNGSIEEQSFKDQVVGSSLTDNIDSINVVRDLVNQKAPISNGIFDGTSIYSTTTTQANPDNETEGLLGAIINNIELDNYAEWAQTSIGINTKDKRDIFEHVIENSAVSDVAVVFTIQQLFDTYIKEDHAGSQVPAFLELGITLGLEGDQNPADPLYDTLVGERKVYLIGIEGLVTQGFRFKIGDYSQSSVFSMFESVGGQEFSSSNNFLRLPNPIKGKNRYIKVYRITPETFSSKRQISISVAGINEYYPYQFTYPLSAISSTRISSRSFSNLPARTFDLKLKKILVPSNYFPTRSDGTDKRLIENSATYDGSNLIYEGDWDGTFKFIWSDNPAWIVYDMLTNPIYGIGNSIDGMDDINIWELYKIGRYADAVDDNGYFVGVPDGYGGLEPRFSFNAMFNNEQEAYDMINSIAVAFRGSVYYAGSEIDFYYDRPDEVIGIFNNKNVKEGSFNYSDTLKSSRYTIVEVPYLDKRDNYLQKIEYYEDEENIAKYGYVKKTFEGIGITSRGQAQRFAKYALLSNKYETESVGFIAKEEAMFLSPGDIIRIDDELKNIDTAEGFILDVDTINNRFITNYMDTSEFDTGIYVYKVTDETGIKDIFENVYKQNQNVTLDQINSTNTPKINFYNVNQYSLTGTDNGGSGLVIDLDNGDGLSDVRVGSFFSINKTGRNENLFKVISINDIGDGEFEVTAQKSQQNKYALIDSGVYFSEEETYFESIPNDFNNNAPDRPASVSVQTGIVNGLFTVSGFINRSNTTPYADQFEAVLISPFGNSQTKIVDYTTNPTTVSFDGLKEYNGEYEFRAYSISLSPYYMKSADYRSTTINVPIEDISVYNKIRVLDVDFGITAQGEFESDLFVGGNDSGNFETYLKDFNFNVKLRDRFGDKISTKQQMEQHWDDPKISIDILDENQTVKKYNHRFKETNLNFNITEDSLKSYFDGEFPRNFRIQIRVTGNTQTEETTGTCVINNPAGKITEWAVSSFYDGVQDGFSIFMDAPMKYKGDITKFQIYTGIGDFTPSESNLLTERIPDQSTNNINKKLQLYTSGSLPLIANNSLFSISSVKDTLFKQGEKIFFTTSNGGSLPEPIQTETQYEIILGKTISSQFYLDADYDYVNEQSSIKSLSYGLEGNINEDYIQLDRLSSSDSLDHVNGGVGLLYPSISQSDYVTISDDVFYFYKFRGIKNEYSNGFIFADAGIRMATSGVSTYPMQKEYPEATFSTYVNANIRVGKQTVFDFGSPTGGVLFFVENQDGTNTNFDYTFRAITKDQSNGTGEMIEMTGTYSGGGPLPFTSTVKHFSISLSTISGESSSIVKAYLYIDGIIDNFKEVSGWGINDHDHACAIGAMIGDSVGESASSIGNYYRGRMTDIAMYSYNIDFTKAEQLFYGSLNEYKFQISTGNNEIFEITGDNVEDSYFVTSANSKVFKLDIAEDIRTNVSLKQEIASKIGYNGVRKTFSFRQVDSVQQDDLIYKDITEYPYYLNEINYLSEEYIWQNFVFPKYKVTYLPNLPGSDITSYDKAGALVLYTPNNNEKINVTGIYVQEIEGVRYARLFLDEEYLNLTEGIELEFPNYDSLILTGLDSLGITSTECQFLNYQNFENVSTNILLTGTNSNTGYENFTGWGNIFQASEALIQDTGEIVLGKQSQGIIDDSEDYFEGAIITPRIPLQTGEWYTASLFYKTDTNSNEDLGWNFRVVLGNENQVYGSIAGIIIHTTGNTLEEWKEPAQRDAWENYFEYGDTGIIPSGSEGWNRAFFNFKPKEIVYIDSETNLEVDETHNTINIVQLYLTKPSGSESTGSGIFALPQIELATGTSGNSPSTQQPTVWNSPEYPIAEIPVGENRGFNNYKQLNVLPYNQNITVNNSLQIQSSAVVQKSVEASGLYTGDYARAVTGYIGGPNGEKIEWEGDYKRYDNLFNNYLSITGYYPYGRWIIYSGTFLTGEGPVWGGWDIIAHYTGKNNTPGLISIPDGFEWGDDTTEIEKALPIGASFECFKTDYSIVTNKEATYEMTQIIGEDTSLSFSDFNIKIKPIDIWGESDVFPSGNNYPLQVNYVSAGSISAENQGKEAIRLAQNSLQLVNYIKNDLKTIVETNYSTPEEIGGESQNNTIGGIDLSVDNALNNSSAEQSDITSNNKVSIPYFEYPNIRGVLVKTQQKNQSIEITYIINVSDIPDPYTVNIISNTNGATIYYRTDSQQNWIQGNQFTIDINQDVSFTIIAKATKNGFDESEENIINFNINLESIG